MTIDREKIVFCFKALLCILLIALWSFWFTNSSKEITHKKNARTYHHKKKKKHVQIKERKENKSPLVKSKIKDSKISKEKTNLQNNLVKEFPKLVTLTPIKTNTERDSIPLAKLKTENNIPKEMINLNLPEIASATRKALLNNSKNNSETLPKEQNSPLRKTVSIEKNKFKPVSISLKENKNRDLGQKIYLDKDEIQNPETVAEQIELSGIVNNLNGESTAIIRNKTNNYIEILKKGDKYKGLKLLEINKSEIVMLDETSNKTYIKKINIGE